MECITPTAAAWRMTLNDQDHRILKIIGDHVGGSDPITLDSVATVMLGAPCSGRETPPLVAREIKACVRRLRRAGYKIGSRRGKNPGFFAIATSEELSATVRPLLRQAVDQLRTIEALTGHDYYARELAGQLKLFGEATHE